MQGHKRARGAESGDEIVPILSIVVIFDAPATVRSNRWWKFSCPNRPSSLPSVGLAT